MKEIKIKKVFIEKVLQDFQEETHTLFRDQTMVRKLIEYTVAKFILASNGIEK